jgi:C4-dicarboxylate-specific signal transduction histidine kinase/ABC-type uncharacterized transport system substrate-binding protein
MRFIAHPALRQGLGMHARRRCVLAMLLIAALMQVGTLWAQSAPGRNVLVLFSNGRLLPANVEIDRGLAEGLSARPEMRAELSAEFLDAPRFAGAAYADTMATYLRKKYAAHVPEVIVVIGTEALDFVLSKRAQMFPTVPVIHQAVAVERLRSLVPLPADVIGVPVDLDFLGTATQALRWHPAARRIVVVTGSGEWDRDWQARVRQAAAKLDGGVSLEFLAGLPSEDLRKRLGALGSDSIVFTPGFFVDGDGRRVVPIESARFVAAVSAAPVYAPYPTFIGTGVVGGSMASFVDTGRLAAQIAIALLGGAAPASVELPQSMPNRVHLDWRQVQRWGISPETVPPDAVVRHREPRFWEAYWHYLLIAGAVLLIQSGLIVALLLERRRRRRTAAALAQSEQRMSLAAHAARLSMWVWDLGRKQNWLRTPSRRSTDLRTDHFTDFNDVLSSVHPQDRESVDAAVKRALSSGEEIEVEYRIAGPDGEVRWMAARGRADQGNPQRLLGVTLDITPRKRAEAQAEQDRTALRHMTRVSLLGQLSASIAHQLNQPLASILSNAEAAQAMLKREPVDLPELREICSDIVAEDHRAADVIRHLGVLFKRGEPLFAPLDVNELVRDTLELTRTNLLTRQVAAFLRLAPDLPLVDGDRVQLQQLLLNLIVNAADAMEATPMAERQLTISTALSGPQIQLCVADRGPGIPGSDLNHVFEPFWTTKGAGMGIGLAICRSIVAAHRGSLSSANAQEGGAIFCTLLPVRATP